MEEYEEVYDLHLVLIDEGKFFVRENHLYYHELVPFEDDETGKTYLNYEVTLQLGTQLKSEEEICETIEENSRRAIWCYPYEVQNWKNFTKPLTDEDISEIYKNFDKEQIEKHLSEVIEKAYLDEISINTTKEKPYEVVIYGDGDMHYVRTTKTETEAEEFLERLKEQAKTKEFFQFIDKEMRVFF